MDAGQVERNRIQQVQLYGEPLGEQFKRLASVLGLTQQRLARLVGLSPPMLSQLMSAQRVKIGNPAVVSRVQALGVLADDVVHGRIGPAMAEQRLAAVAELGAVLTTATQATTGSNGSRATAGASAVTELVRRVGAPAELRSAVALLEPEHPGVAELLRVYGLGRPEDAVDHYARHVPG